MKKFLSFIMAFVLLFTTFLPCVCAADEVTASQVEEMLKNIDTLQQMQNKRSTYKASGHYDITTTNSSVIAKHKTARDGYESYVSEMFAKRAEAQQAYDELSDEQKAQIDPALVAKLNNELPTVFETGEWSVTPRDDEYSFEAVKVGVGFGYEVSNHMISGDIPQTFVLVDTYDGATAWTPSGEYICGESNYEVAYCCDKETGLEYGSYYKRINLEDSSYFDTDEAQHIRAVLQNSYPFVTINQMKDKLKDGGLDAEFVDSLTRADLIAAVQMAVWSYANINDAAADGLEYFASIDVPNNKDIYFHAFHDYTNEIWDWLPGKRQRTYDARAQYRVNTLGEYLCSLEPVEATADEVVISHVEVLRTKLDEHGDGSYDLTVLINVNGTILPNDDVDIIVSSYSENEEGGVTITSVQSIDAVPGQMAYKTVVNTRDADTIKVEVKGIQELPKGVYFYEPENGRDSSQTLVGVAEGRTAVHAENKFKFTPDIEITPVVVPVTGITVNNTEFELEPGKTEKITVTVTPDDATNKEVTYISSDETVVRVDENGNIEAVGEGTATITVTSKDDPTKKDTITITVKKPLPQEPSYTITVPESLSLVIGDKKPVGVVITPDDGKINPVYKSADESIVKVDANGNVTAIGVGNTTISVDLGNGDIRIIPVAVAAPVVPSIPRKHHIAFGKTDGIGWYEVSVNGGDFFPQGPNSTLEVDEGSVLVVRVQDMWIDDNFTFYVNGDKVKPDAANTITVVVDGYMLIGALSMDVEVPDVDESLSLFEKILNAIRDFFRWLFRLD